MARGENGWTKVPLALRDYTGLSWRATWLFIVMRSHTRPERPTCWPAHETLAEWSDLTEWGVRKALTELEQAGLLTIEPPRPGRRTNTYQLSIPSGKWLAVENRLLADPNLEIEDKLLFICLFWDLPFGKRKVFKDQTALAKEMSRLIPGFTRRRVQLALARLEANGYLTSEWPDRRRPKAYTYAPFLGEPPHLTGQDGAQEGHVQQDVGVQESTVLTPDAPNSHDGGDHHHRWGPLAGKDVHQFGPIQDRDRATPKALSPQGPLTSPRGGSQADAPRIEAASRSQIDRSMCNSVQQDSTELKGTRCSSETSGSQQRSSSSVRGEGDSSRGSGFCFKGLGIKSDAKNSPRRRSEGPLELEELPPLPDDPWRLPRYHARCARCEERFKLIRFEVELRHTLCPRCRIEVVNSGEGWPGYGTPRPRRWRGGAGSARENTPGQEAIFSGAIGNCAPVHGLQ